jgi:hypothetical protein
MALMDKLGRKMLLLWSFFGMVNCTFKSLSSFYVKFSIVIIVLNLCIMYLEAGKEKEK